MSIHTKIDKNGQIIELLATNQDAVLANAAPALLEALKKISDIEDACKRRKVGYDYQVDQIAKIAIAKGKERS